MNEEKLKQSKEKSLEDLRQNIKIHEQSLHIQEEKLRLIKEIFKMSLDKIQLVNPEREFQRDPKYWDLMRQWETIEHEHKVLSMEVDIQRIKKVLNETLEQYKILGGE